VGYYGGKGGLCEPLTLRQPLIIDLDEAHAGAPIALGEYARCSPVCGLYADAANTAGSANEACSADSVAWGNVQDKPNIAVIDEYGYVNADLWGNVCGNVCGNVGGDLCGELCSSWACGQVYTASAGLWGKNEYEQDTFGFDAYAGTGQVAGTFTAGGLVVTGTVNFSALPTSDPQVAGQLWNDSGTVKVSAGGE
jgi:hypothetical protein